MEEELEQDLELDEDDEEDDDDDGVKEQHIERVEDEQLVTSLVGFKFFNGNDDDDDESGVTRYFIIFKMRINLQTFRFSLRNLQATKAEFVF